MNRKQKNEKSSKINSKQIVALSGVILLALLYLVTLIVAIVDDSASGSLVKLCLFGTVAIPILIWVYTWMYGKLTGRDTIADFDHKNDKNAD
ncbi:MAG: hypothetical protein NC417_09700 [Candidatus Gastranaerophilales bacterium]|nr:hypothetical protein [Candidatus Gastranaerophilales bacterium]